MANSVTISYGNTVIRTSSQTETVILRTANTECDENITVNSVLEGGNTVYEKDVNFYDYDGTLVDSYTKADFLNLGTMPNNPVKEGFTAQGWNWDLATAQAYVTNHGALDIGQMRVTSDGKTRLYVELFDGALSPTVAFGINGTATIDWGDGSATSTVTGTSVSTLISAQHTYATKGEYVIEITGAIAVIQGSSNSKLFCKSISATTNEDACYKSSMYKIEFGNIYGIGTYSLHNCYGLRTVNIPQGITIIGNSLANTFQSCGALECLVLPKGVTALSANMCRYAYGVKHILLPQGVTSTSTYPFGNIYGMRKIFLPDTITSMSNYLAYNSYNVERIELPQNNTIKSVGTSAFYQCYALYPPKLPPALTSLTSTFYYNNGHLTEVTIPTTVTTLGNHAFYNCYILQSITGMDNVKTLGTSVFYQCYCLKEIVLPKITSISNSTFYNCVSLIKFTIPSTVTTIGTNAFYGCLGLKELHFQPTTPPTVADANAWTDLPTDCKIYVPTGYLSAYTSAQYYPSSSTYTYIEE